MPTSLPTPQELKKLAKSRLQESEILFSNRKYDAAVYLVMRLNKSEIEILCFGNERRFPEILVALVFREILTSFPKQQGY